MARIALVMTYPYEAFSGGEQAYVGALRRYLVAQGHQVETIVSDICRGRTNPVVSLRRAGAGPVTVRRTLPIGRSRFLSVDPQLVVRSLLSIVGRRRHGAERTTAAEQRWLRGRLETGRYEAIILMWDACTITPELTHDNIIALRGFFSDRDYALGETPAATLPAEDIAALARYALVGLNNCWEAQALDAARTRGVIYVGMGFAPQRPLAPAEQPIILFVGADTRPNRESLRWFIDRIWPAVLAKHADARFHIVGGVGYAIGALPHGVTALGRVDDLSEAYAAAQIVVTPIVTGSAGVKTKVAEALAHAKPLVTTSLGVDPGDPDQMQGDVDVVDDPEAFAAAVTRLLSDADLRRERMRRSAAAFERLFSDQAAYGELTRALSL